MSRQLIFILIALSVAIPLVIRIGLPNEVTSEVMHVYEEIDRLEAGSVVLVSFDHEASSLPEVKPMAQAILHHCFAKKLKVIGLALLAEGTAVGEQILRATADEHQAVHGQDYVFLGFRPQYQAAILGMGEDIRRVFPEDYSNTPLARLPMMRKVKNYEDICLIISVSDGDMPKRLAVATTAVMATSFYPFLSSGQMVGLLGGLKGAAEYEMLIKKPGMGQRGMDAQSVCHLVIILLVIAGNVGYFMKKPSTVGRPPSAAKAK
ncbi:hypothetical protein AMJ44_15825 [candidate division WOR-1 bacterium DG_54_3]|uniref:Uncharacterized protein n=1 Tax=candidate division WOR-1 bacterium DG_54_3 TaxID=1703775 RepID=A0A0S7XIK6_UNCSA|nr:MAG: hypothetical protein AMJ44_15825 [candidate division WOR-1 bacterium DG_54_3]